MINNSIHTGKTFATLAVMLMATVVMLQAAPTATAADTTRLSPRRPMNSV